MEQNKTRVEYTITIKGNDGSESVYAGKNIALVVVGDDSATDVFRRFQANFFDLIAMYASIVEIKEKIESMSPLVPVLYNAGREFGKLNEDIVIKGDIAQEKAQEGGDRS